MGHNVFTGEEGDTERDQVPNNKYVASACCLLGV